jgi:hypothetical protein
LTLSGPRYVAPCLLGLRLQLQPTCFALRLCVFDVQVAEGVLDSQSEERRRLKQLSDERAAKWPNTLQAQRARKERARMERMAAEEAERVEVRPSHRQHGTEDLQAIDSACSTSPVLQADRAEAEIRAEHRRIQIERANSERHDGYRCH